MEKHLEEEKQTLCQLFREEQEKWTGNVAEKTHLRPIAEPQDCQKAQMYRWGATACTLLEAAMAGFIFANLGLPWWLGALVAVLLVVIFEAGFSLTFDEPDEPTKAYVKIRRWLLGPSFVIFVVSALTLLLARTIPESWVPQLMEVFNLSLWSTTVSLLLLGGALLAAAHLRGWSGHITALYEAVDGLQHRVRCVEAELEGQLSTLRAKSMGQQESASSPSLSEQPAIVLNGSAIAATILLPALLSVCPAFTNHASAQAQLLAPKPCHDMDLYIDHSRSLSEAPLTSTVHELLRQLPQIVETWDVCGELRVTPWAQDGWSAAPILSLQLPQLTLRKPQPLSHTGEVGFFFSNVTQALEKRHAAQAAAADARARQDYREQVAQTLATVTENALLPSAVAPAPACSDLNGVLRRITTTTSAKPRLVMLVTDGHESCTPTLQPVPTPAGTVTVVTILIPENATGKKKSKTRGYDQFETRRAALVQAAPWARVYPYHQRDFISMFSPEHAELALQK
jgi:hypothetical protein